MRRWAAILPLLLAGCAAPHTRTAGDGPPTLVSLNPCADAILHEVAAPGQVLAISHYSQSAHATSMPLDSALAYRATGGTVEEVLALDPDVVVGDMFMAPATRNAFERLGVRVETIGIASDLETSLAQVRQVAEVAERKPAGEVLAERIEQAWASAAQEGPAMDALLWQSGGIVAGDNSLVAALLEQTGFANHAASRGLGQGAYVPLERVLADPPELVLAAGEERMLNHPVLRQLDGVRYERLDPALLYCGGPTIIRALARLRDIRDAASPHPPASVGGP